MTGSKKKLPKSSSERTKLIDKDHPNIPIMRQCQLLEVNRSNIYYQPRLIPEFDLFLMERIDKLYTDHPFYGAPRITKHLNLVDKITVNHKKIERLMRIMGIQAVYPKRNTSKPSPNNTKYPYLLRGVKISRPNQVWGTDITYIRANHTWFYLVALMDWHSRYVLSWQLSNSLSIDFCITALKQALDIAQPEIHNSDQGSQFTAEEYLAVLKQYGNIRISMDGRGRCFDNIFNERLWRSVKYEEVYLHDYQNYTEANNSLSKYFQFYNHERLHQSLNYQTPAKVYFGDKMINSLKNEAIECSLTHEIIPERHLTPVQTTNF